MENYGKGEGNDARKWEERWRDGKASKGLVRRVQSSPVELWNPADFIFTWSADQKHHSVRGNSVLASSCKVAELDSDCSYIFVYHTIPVNWAVVQYLIFSLHFLRQVIVVMLRFCLSSIDVKVWPPVEEGQKPRPQIIKHQTESSRELASSLFNKPCIYLHWWWIQYLNHWIFTL